MAGALGLLDDVLGQGLHMPVGGAAADHEVIHDIADALDVQGDGVDALEVIQRVLHEFDECLGGKRGSLVLVADKPITPLLIRRGHTARDLKCT